MSFAFVSFVALEMEKWSSGCGDWTVIAHVCEGLHKRVQGVHGINRGRGLGALVALSSLSADTLSTILSDKWAVLVELAVSSIPVVN